MPTWPASSNRANFYCNPLHEVCQHSPHQGVGVTAHHSMFSSLLRPGRSGGHGCGPCQSRLCGALAPRGGGGWQLPPPVAVAPVLPFLLQLPYLVHFVPDPSLVGQLQPPLPFPDRHCRILPPLS
jgi:hypothetical protein